MPASFGIRSANLDFLTIPFVIGCSLLGSHSLQAQEFYTTPTSRQPAAIQQTVQDGAVGQDLGVSPSGRSAFTTPTAGNSTAPANGVSSGGALTTSTPSTEGGGEKSSGLGFADLAGGTRNPFKTTVSIREGYDDNTTTSNTNRVGSFYTNLAAGIRYDFGSPRLRLTSNLTGGASLYYSRPGRKLDLSTIYTLSAAYSASSRLTLDISSTVGWYPQPDVGITGTQFSNQDGSYLYGSTTIGANYQWATRFSTTTSYNFRVLSYADSGLQASQGNISQTINQSFNFQLWPTTTLVAEYRANAVTYFEADLDSMGNYALLGFDHVFNPLSRWNFRGGLEQRFNQNPIDGESLYLGPYLESTAIYRFTSRSEIAWSTRYGTEQSGLTDVTQRQTFRTGISVSHGFTGRLSASADFFYSVNYYDQPNVMPDYYQNVFQTNLGLNFAINRLISLSAGYQFTKVLAQSQPDQEYYRNIVFLGVNSTF